MNNIAEGYERKGQGEFAQFLTIAKASTAEIRSMSYLGHDVGFISDSDRDMLFKHTDEVARLLARLRETVERNRAKGAIVMTAQDVFLGSRFSDHGSFPRGHQCATE